MNKTCRGNTCLAKWTSIAQITSFLNNTHRTVGPDCDVEGMVAVKRLLKVEDGCRACRHPVVLSD